jgi:CheY-like chemotaxis protein
MKSSNAWPAYPKRNRPRRESISAIESIQRLQAIEGVSGIHLMAIEWEHKVPEIIERAGLYPKAGSRLTNHERKTKTINGGNQMSNQPLILVVDDDPDLVESVCMKLENEKYRTAKAYDGVEAWEKIKEERPVMLILDVMMPNKNGYQLCDEIKKDEAYNDITVLLLTAVADAVTSTNYTHNDGITTLADDFIPKPIDMDKLMEIVQDYMTN